LAPPARFSMEVSRQTYHTPECGKTDTGYKLARSDAIHVLVIEL